MKLTTRYYIKCLMLLAAIDEWFMKYWLARLIVWIAIIGQFNVHVTLPLIVKWMDPNPSEWLQVGVMIPLNLSMLYFWDAFHLWFWQAAHRSIDKYLPKQEDSTL